MDAKLKADWVKALRSGEYKQTDGVLRSKTDCTSFCCLGVLCDVMGATWDHRHPQLDGVFLQDDHYGDLLSDQTLKLVGFDDRTQTELAEMNDEGTPFTAIADYIEKEIA